MIINLKNLISITEANKNFSQVAKMADKSGTIVILKNNTPKYVLLDYEKLQESAPADPISVEQAAIDFIYKKSEKETINYCALWDPKTTVLQIKETGIQSVFFCCCEKNSEADSSADWNMERIVSLLKEEGIQTELFNGFPADFSEEHIDAGKDRFLESQAGCMIVLDTVYSLDMAKAITQRFHNPTSIYVFPFWTRRV